MCHKLCKNIQFFLGIARNLGHKLIFLVSWPIFVYVQSLGSQQKRPRFYQLQGSKYREIEFDQNFAWSNLITKCLSSLHHST